MLALVSGVLRMHVPGTVLDSMVVETLYLVLTSSSASMTTEVWDFRKDCRPETQWLGHGSADIQWTNAGLTVLAFTKEVKGIVMMNIDALWLHYKG